MLEKAHRWRAGKGHLRTEAISVPGTDTEKQQHLRDALEEVALGLGLEEWWHQPVEGGRGGGLSK